MPRKLPIFYSALLLTGVNLLLRLIGTSFQVYLSAAIGAAGIGLLQLTMSVGSLAMVAGMGGIRTATMYLTAEELGKGRKQNVTWILSGCTLYSIIFSVCVGLLLSIFAPEIAENWIGDTQTTDALRLLAIYLPTTCLCGVMTGYFTAANRIGTLAAVEVAEQLCSMALTMIMLTFWAGNHSGKACLSGIMGSSFGACLTLILLVSLRLLEHPDPSPRIPLRSRLLQAAVPLALADDLKSGINTLENLMVPKRLGLNRAVENPLASFGLVSGMVFPVIMFPSAILFGLTELLIPELARCNTAGQKRRIDYLVEKGLRAALIYGILFGGLLHLLSKELCAKLYQNNEAAAFLSWYALLVPMLYCDILTDAMTKGLGQQRFCVRYNIFTSVLDVIFLYYLLPIHGMKGYYLSFAITHLINFILSLNRLLKITGIPLPKGIFPAAITAFLFSLYASRFLASPLLRAVAYVIISGCILFLTGILTPEDARWFHGLIHKKTSPVR